MVFTIPILFGASCLAFGVGILTGVFGVGGGFLMTPGLMILLGVPGPVAVGTDLATILATSTFAVHKRRGKRTFDKKMAVTIGAGSVVGVLFGSELLGLLKNVKPIVVFGKTQNAVEYVLLCLFLVLLVWIALYMILKSRGTHGEASGPRNGLFSQVNLPPKVRYHSIGGDRHFSMPILAGIGGVIGCLTGLMGIGGGVVLLPSLIYLVGQDPKKAVGTSLLLVWMSSVIGVIHKSALGQISFPLWAAMVVGGVLGTYVGTRIGLKVSSEKIQGYFSYIVILGAVMIGVKLYCMTV